MTFHRSLRALTPPPNHEPNQRLEPGAGLRTHRTGEDPSPLCDNCEALDPSALEGAQEDVVVLERHAAVGIAVRTQHVGMRQQPNAIEGKPSADRVQTQSLNPMKDRFAQRELINAGRRRAVIALVHETGIVDPIAKARMGFQTHTVRQIHGMRRDVVDRGRLVVTRSRSCRAAPIRGAETAATARERPAEPLREAMAAARRAGSNPAATRFRDCLAEERRFGSAAVRALQGAPRARSSVRGIRVAAAKGGGATCQRRQGGRSRFRRVGLDATRARQEIRPGPGRRRQNRSPRTIGRTSDRRGAGTTPSTLRQPAPSQVDRNRDRPAAAGPAAKSGMAFARRTGRGLVFPLRRKLPELRTPCQDSSNLPLNTNTRGLQSGCDPDHSAASAPRRRDGSTRLGSAKASETVRRRSAAPRPPPRQRERPGVVSGRRVEISQIPLAEQGVND